MNIYSGLRLTDVNATIELLEQAEAERVQIDYIVFATGSDSTHAGLIVGTKLLGPQIKVIGISVCEDLETITRFVNVITRRTFEELGFPTIFAAEDTIILEEYLKGGYGILDRGTTMALRQ